MIRKTTVLAWAFVLWAVSLAWAAETGGPDFERHLEGTVGSVRVQMDIEKTGNTLKGSYFYEKYRKDIPLKGRVVGSGIRLEEKGAVIEGEFAKDGTLSGVWVGKDINKPLKVALREAPGSVSLDTVSAESKVALKSKAIEKCEIEWLYLYPVRYRDGKNLGKIRGVLWKSYFGENDPSKAKGDPRRAIDMEVKGFIDECREAGKDEEDDRGVEWTSTKKMSEVYNKKGILSVRTDTWESRGGYRPTIYTNFAVVDLEKGTLLTLKDIFKDGYDRYLGQLVTGKLKDEAYEMHKTRNLKKAGYSKFKENSLNDGDFYMTGEGIHFFYNVFALGDGGESAVVSETDLLVPFAEIKKEFFRPESAVYRLVFGAP